MKQLFAAILIVLASSGGALAATSNEAVWPCYQNDLTTVSNEVVFGIEQPMWAIILDEDAVDEGYED